MLRSFFIPVFILAVPLFCAAVPAMAKDSLGIFGQWGAFRDAQVPRCYAIAMPQPPGPQARQRSEQDGFASIGTWPRRDVRGQLHLRLTRRAADTAPVTLAIGRQNFTLTARGGDAWAQDRAMDAAILSAMRTADSMRVTARDRNGQRFTDSYALSGAATALDAAAVACARG